MSDGMMMIIGDDGVARLYNDEYDITIHCESKEEQDRVWNMLTRRWIPCEKRPPDVGRRVLCQCRAGIMDILQREQNGSWVADVGTHYCSGFVIAWMELPMQYTGEDVPAEQQLQSEPEKEADQ